VRRKAQREKRSAEGGSAQQENMKGGKTKPQTQNLKNSLEF
jgi:hypothetical protein